MTAPRPDRPDIEDALTELSQVTQPSLAVKYAAMWLREAAAATSAHDEARHLAKAEEQVGRALLASAAPSAELATAYATIQRARHDATD